MERYDDAVQWYDRILHKDSTNTAPGKHKIATLKSSGASVEVTREVIEYLEQFVGDQETWPEHEGFVSMNRTMLKQPFPQRS